MLAINMEEGWNRIGNGKPFRPAHPSSIVELEAGAQIFSLAAHVEALAGGTLSLPRMLFTLVDTLTIRLFSSSW